MNEITLDKPEWAQSKREKEHARLAAAGQPVPRRRRWPWLVLVLLIVGGIVYLVVSRQNAAPPPEPVEAAPASQVIQLNSFEIATIQPRTLEQTVKVTGSLAPQQKADVTSQVAGKLQTVSVRPGDHVEAGQVIAQIDVTDLQVSLNQQTATRAATQAQLNLARTQLQSATALAERGNASQSTLESAQSSVNGLQSQVAALDAQVEAAERAIQNATIRAPIAGMVASRSVEPGQAITQGTPMFSLVDLSIMEAQTTAPVSASALIRPGQQVTLAVEGIPNRTFSGEVDRINPVAIENTRSLTVYLTIDNSEGLFRGGMFTSGQIIVDRKADALAVPAAAIREDAEGKYVLKIADGKLVRQGVEPGRQWSAGNLVEIPSGLVAGDVVVTAVLNQLEPGMSVAVVGD